MEENRQGSKSTSFFFETILVSMALSIATLFRTQKETNTEQQWPLEYMLASPMLISKEVSDLCQDFLCYRCWYWNTRNMFFTMVESTKYCTYHFMDLVAPREIYVKYQNHEVPEEIFPSVLLFSNHLGRLTCLDNNTIYHNVTHCAHLYTKKAI